MRSVSTWLNITTDHDHNPDHVRPLMLPPGTKPTVWSLILHALSGFSANNLPLMAAALAYRTIFGLVPIIIIGLAIIGGLAGEAQTRDFVNRMLDYSGIRGIDASSGPQDDPFVSNGKSAHDETMFFDLPDVEGAEKVALAAEATAGRQRLDELIQGLVTRVRGIPFTAIGVVGFLLLVYAAISMVVEVETAFNTVYEAPSGRSWAQRLPRYWTLLTLGAMCLVGTFYVGETFRSWVAELVKSEMIGNLGQSLLLFAGFATTVAISTVLLLVIYFTLPNARVRFGPALLGAILAAASWELLKLGYTQYVAKLPSYSMYYGSIAVVPLFLFWIYLTWLIVLGGLQIARSLQVFGHLRGLGAAAFIISEQPSVSGPLLIDPGIVAPAMVVVGNRFAQGKPTTPSDACQSMGLPGEIAELVFTKLCDAGMLMRVLAGPDEEFAETRYTLARPPERIGLDDLLRVGFAISDGSRGGELAPVAPALHRLREAQLSLSAGRSLAMELDQPEVVAPVMGAMTPGGGAEDAKAGAVARNGLSTGSGSGSCTPPTVA